MKDQGVRRYISWYEKTGDDFIDDEDLFGIKLDVLQKLFNVDKSNPMYDCWKIKGSHVAILQKHLKHIINIEKYDYFVEAESIDKT